MYSIWCRVYGMWYTDLSGEHAMGPRFDSAAEG